MIDSVRDWYRARSRREQVMLAAMLIVAIPVLLWLLLVRPVQGWHDDARIEMLEASDRLGRVRTLVQMAEGGNARSPRSPINQPLADFVAASADQAGFALTRNTPSGPDRTDVGVAQARPDAALAWLADLRSDGIVIESVRMTDNGDGGVELDLSLSKGGA